MPSNIAASQGRVSRAALGAGLIAVVWLVAPSAGAQSTTSADDILRSLASPTPLTRSIGPSNGSLGPDDAGFVRSLDTGLSRGLKVVEREKVQQIVEQYDLPRIDITVEFDFDSDRIRPDSLPALAELGKALKDARLGTARILLNGHTDAKGSDSYNQDLSERRAVAVRRHLVESLGVDGARLIAAGFGESRPKDAANGESAVNRRVEIINLTAG